MTLTISKITVFKIDENKHKTLRPQFHTLESNYSMTETFYWGEWEHNNECETVGIAYGDFAISHMTSILDGLLEDNPEELNLDELRDVLALMMLANDMTANCVIELGY